MTFRVGRDAPCMLRSFCFIAFYTSWRPSDEDRLDEILAIRGLNRIMPRTAGCELNLEVLQIELRTMLSVHASLIIVWSSDHFDNHLEGATNTDRNISLLLLARANVLLRIEHRAGPDMRSIRQGRLWNHDRVD